MLKPIKGECLKGVTMSQMEPLDAEATTTMICCSWLVKPDLETYDGIAWAVWRCPVACDNVMSHQLGEIDVHQASCERST